MTKRNKPGNEELSKSIDDAASVLTPAPLPFVNAPRYTAESGKFGDGKTEAIDVIDEPADGEQNGNHEVSEVERTFLTKAIGSVALESLINANDAQKVIGKIWSTKQYREFLIERAEVDAGSRTNNNEKSQLAVRDWLDKVRSEVQSSTGAPAQADELTDTDPQDYAAETKGESTFGEKLSGNSSLLMIGLSDKWQARRERKAREFEEKEAAEQLDLAKKMTDQGQSQDQIDEEIEKRNKKRNRRINIGIAVGTVATLGVIFAHSRGYLGFDPSKMQANIFGLHIGGSTDPNQLPQGGGVQVDTGTPQPRTPNQPPVTPDQLPGGLSKAEQAFLTHYFDAPDTSNIPVGSGGKNHINDFAPGSVGLLNGDKNLALSDVEKMLRGNPRIAATYFSELGIGDAPKMPSIDQMNNPTVAAQYHTELNNWADGLKPEQRFLYTQETLKQIGSAQFGAPVEFQSGYASWGINETGQDIFGTHKDQVFYDTVVNYKGVKFVPFTINGQTHYFNTLCNQLSTGIPLTEAPAPAPQHFVPVQEVPQRQEVPVQHYKEVPVKPSTPRPTSTPTPRPTPTPTPTPHPTPTPTPTPPTLAPKIPRQDINANPGLPEQLQMGDVRVGPGAEQTVNQVQPEPFHYEPPKSVTNNNDVAPEAKPSTGLFNGGQAPAQSGLNGSPSSSTQSGSSSSAGASENTSSASE